MTLEFSVLGPLEVRRDGHRLDLGAPKQRTVLARLVLARGRVVPSDQLLDVVWGDDPPPSALASLQVYVSNLRRLLREESGGVSPLVRQAPGYVLRPGRDAVDLENFLEAVARARGHLEAEEWVAAADAGRRAAACWRGPVLADQGDADWFTSDARALHDQLVEVRCLHGTALLGAGQVAEAVAVAQGVAGEEPFRDDVHRLLVLALHRAGRTAEALEALTAYAARLDDELGIELSTELRELQVALLRQEPWTTTWPVTHGTSSPGPLQTPSRPSATTATTATTAPAERSRTLVGRRAQLAVAEPVVDRVLSGAASWLLLTGPAGIGKTRLAEEVAADVELRGGRTVRARCLEEEGAPPWWPLRQVVQGLGADPDTVLRAPGDAEADTVRFAVYERVRALLEQASGPQPLAVLVDDLQWADVTTLRALSYLATSMTSARVLVLATVRDGEGGPQARRTVADLARAEGARHLVVPPLTDDDVAVLASTVAGEQLDPDETRLLADRTGGNALFVTEYARLSRHERQGGEVPLAVRGVLGRRLESLDAAVLQVLRAAAVIGDVLDLDLLAAVTRMDVDDLVDLLDDAADEHIIEPRRDGAGYAFSHALLREEVLAGISALRRQRLHLRVADTLAGQGGEQVTRRAQHLLAARPLGEPRALLEACRSAALEAEERWASDSAVQWWESAREAAEQLSPGDRDPQEADDLLVAEVRALARSGRGQTVLDVVEREVLEATRRGHTSTVGRLAASLVRAAGTWPWAAIGEDYQPLLERLAALDGFVANDPPAHARLLAARGVGACYHPDPSVPDELSTRALALAEATGDPEVVADALLGRVLTYVGVASHAEECERLLGRMLALPRVGGDVDAVIAHSAMTMSSTLMGDLPAAEEHQRLGIAGCDLLRLPVVRVQLRWMEVGLVDWRRGSEAALSTHRVALESHLRTELYEQGFGEMSLRMLHWQLGRLSELPEYDGLEGDTWRAAAAAERGDADLATRAVEERLAHAEPFVWATLGHLVVLAHVVCDLGLTPYAPRLLALLLPHLGRLAIVGQGPILGPVDLALGRLHRLLGDEDQARSCAASGRELALRNGGLLWAERCRRLVGPRDLPA